MTFDFGELSTAESSTAPSLLKRTATPRSILRLPETELWAGLTPAAHQQLLAEFRNSASRYGLSRALSYEIDTLLPYGEGDAFMLAVPVTSAQGRSSARLNLDVVVASVNDELCLQTGTLKRDYQLEVRSGSIASGGLEIAL